jgi:hypothetical protein
MNNTMAITIELCFMASRRNGEREPINAKNGDAERVVG